MADKKAVRPIYSELQGYLSQTPPVDRMPTITDQAIWEQYNQTIDELKTVTGSDYGRFSVQPVAHGYECGVLVSTFRLKLGGVISRLHAEYFSDEPTPFSGMPSTVITQYQNQSQSAHTQLLLDMGELVNAKMQTTKDDPKAKGFLEKVRDVWLV